MTDNLLSDIETALALGDVSQTRFGYLVAGDPTLVTKMRQGRQVRPELERKIREAIERLEKTGEL